MSFVMFLRGYLATLIAFALAAWLITGSPATTLIATAIAAIIIQAGYFAAILFLVAKQPKDVPRTNRACAHSARTEKPAEALQESSRRGRS